MEFTVEGMTCGHCVRAITGAVRRLDPGASVDVDLARGTVVVAGAIEPEAARAAIEAEGYTVVADRGAAADPGDGRA